MTTSFERGKSLIITLLGAGRFTGINSGNYPGRRQLVFKKIKVR